MRGTSPCISVLVQTTFGAFSVFACCGFYNGYRRQWGDGSEVLHSIGCHFMQLFESYGAEMSNIFLIRVMGFEHVGSIVQNLNEREKIREVYPVMGMPEFSVDKNRSNFLTSSRK
jgi:hypothetical protein